MPAEPGKTPRRALMLLAMAGAACALAVWLARPVQPMSAEGRGKDAAMSPGPASRPSAARPPPAAAAAATSEPEGVERLQARAAATDAPSANAAAEPAAPGVRQVSEALRVPIASPAARATPSGIRASQAACAGLLARVQRGDALDPVGLLTWQRECRAR